VVITLKSLPSSHANFIETLNIAITNKDLTFKELSTKILQRDRWKTQFGNSNVNETSEVALVSKIESKGSKQRDENDED
jgi:hypothetical protein